MYIIFEGVDTCGKSTQINLFKERKQNIITTNEPGGTSLGIKLRDILLTNKDPLSLNAEFFLFLADRAEHYKKVIAPNLGKNYILSDRGFVSGIAYGLTNGIEADLDFLIKINRFALNGHLPQKIILFKTNKKLIKSRLSTKLKDNIEKRGIKYLLRVQEKMFDVVKASGIEFLEVDSTWSIEEIYSKIEEFIYD